METISKFIFLGILLVSLNLFASPGHYNRDSYPNRDHGRGHGERIRIESATYGGNCRAQYGNISTDVARYCNNQFNCDYFIDHRRIGDPAVGCAKDFAIQYSCGRGSQTVYVAAEASGKTAHIECSGTGGEFPPPPPPRYEQIEVVSATYGGNCGAYQDNATRFLAQYCYNQNECNYFIDHNRLGDPAPGCAKDFVVRYLCGNKLRSEFISGEASNKWLYLNCNQNRNPNPNPYPQEQMRILNASYGPANVTNIVAYDCNYKNECEFVVDLGRLGDPSPGYGKDFRLTYQCGYYRAPQNIYLSAEAYGKKAALFCN